MANSDPAPSDASPSIAIIGGGPAGLMAAEVLLDRGYEVDLFDRMPSLARKFLMAGKSGLNLSHAEDHSLLLNRYGEAEPLLRPHVDRFTARDIEDWVHKLGIDTFTGSSGKIFPTDYKAAPLLRAWMRKLRLAGLRTHVRHIWTGWTDEGGLHFDTPDGPHVMTPRATVLALGGASWKRLGSDGLWASHLQQWGIEPAPFRPANCGFDIAWSEPMKNHAGAAIKTIDMSFEGAHVRGDLMITATGIEGSAIYGLSNALRDHLEQTGKAVLGMDLLPDLSPDVIRERLMRPRDKKSLSTHFHRTLKLKGAKLALLRECTTREEMENPDLCARAIKTLSLPIMRTRPLDEAISTAGGVRFDDLSAHLMLKEQPGTFCAGEMIDWEAPTGGYLLTACFATGRAAARGVIEYLENTKP